jgi:hypothetical protein
MAFASEEGSMRTLDENRFLQAHCDYQTKHPEVMPEPGEPERGLYCLLRAPETGLWFLSNGISENFKERVRTVATLAGIALGCPKGTNAEHFWFHRLYSDLLMNKSDQLSAASEKGGIIKRVCVASATFCARLEQEALKTKVSVPLLDRQPKKPAKRTAMLKKAVEDLIPMFTSAFAALRRARKSHPERHRLQSTLQQAGITNHSHIDALLDSRNAKAAAIRAVASQQRIRLKTVQNAVSGRR